MSLADDLQRAVTAIKEKNTDHPQCSTCNWLAGLGGKDRKTIEQYIRDDLLPLRNLHRALSLNGLEAAETSLKRHLTEHIDYGRYSQRHQSQ